MNNELEIRDEELFLLGLCRLSFTGEQTEKLKVLAGKIIDWEYFAIMANAHGISALVSRNLDHLGLAEGIPSPVISMLRNSRMLNISRNAFHITAIEEILSLLNRAGIRVVLLKGLALELTVYGNAGLRQMTDVDILVERDNYVKAQSILMENGYDSMPVKSGFHKPIAAWTGKHLPSLMKNGASVDMHLELFAGKKNDLTVRLIKTASEINVDREKVYIPAPQLFFLFLVKHLHQHEINNESQLRLYTDLVVLLESYREEIINYDLIDNASEAGITKILAWKLEPLRDLWGIQFPGWIDDFIDKWFNPDSINKFVFFLKSPKNNRREKPGHVYRNVIKEIPGWHRKVLFIIGDLFPTVRFMKERYGCKTGFRALFYYPLRFGKLFRLISR